MTQPDRPAGRGLAPTASPVRKLAANRGIRILQPASLKEVSVQNELRLVQADVIVTAAFGQIFPQPVLDTPRLGAINIHASLLPRWRGAAPIQRALLAGDEVTGVSIMQMDAGLDTGPVLLQEQIPISNSDTSGTLSDRLAELGGRLVVSALDGLERGSLEPWPQTEKGATYAHKLEKREFRLDWRQDAAAVERRVRVFKPSPGAGAKVRGVDLKIWDCAMADGKGAPGEVLGADERGLRIACGKDALLVTALQRPGGRRLGTPEFLRGFPLSPGERFEA